MIRKHSAKVLSCDLNGYRKFWTLVGGNWYYSGNSQLELSNLSVMPNGYWRDSIAKLIKTSYSMQYKELVQYLKIIGAVKIQIATHEWTSETVKPYTGVPF